MPYPLEISGLLECLFHAGLCILAHGVTDSAINIHRESAGVVAQLLLHGLDGAAGLKGKDRAAMAQIVEPGGLHADSGHALLEVVVYGLMPEMPAQLIGEHKPVRVAPADPGL